MQGVPIQSLRNAGPLLSDRLCSARTSSPNISATPHRCFDQRRHCHPTRELPRHAAERRLPTLANILARIVAQYRNWLFVAASDNDLIPGFDPAEQL
jgi:hypothetical protein